MKLVAPLDPRQGRRRQRADRSDQETRAEATAILQRNAPAPRSVLVNRRGNPAAKLDVAAQVELVGDVVEIAQRFRLAREMLRPVPFLQKLLRKRVAVGIALGIESRAGIAVPVPGAADIGPGLEHPDAQSLLAQSVELVQARHARADDDGVEIRNGRFSRYCGLYKTSRSHAGGQTLRTRSRVAVCRRRTRSALLGTGFAYRLGSGSPVKRRRQGGGKRWPRRCSAS